MRISFLRLLIIVIALPCAVGHRRRLQCDGNVTVFAWSTKHDRVSNGTHNVSLPAATSSNASSLDKVRVAWTSMIIFRNDYILGVVLGIGTFGVFCLMFGACGLYLQKQQEDDEQMQADNVVTLIVLRASGEQFVTLQAKRHWSWREVREEASKHADDGEYVCELVWDNADGFEVPFRDYQYLDNVLGLRDGSTLRAIIGRFCVIAPGCSLFLGSRRVGASRQTARIWVHEDRSAIMTLCTTDSQEGAAKTKWMEGHLDEAGNVSFSCEGCKVSGLLRGTHGRQDITFPQAPMFGKLKLTQSLVEAIFKVGQMSPYKGYITFFSDGEVVLRTSQDGGNVSTQICLWWNREEADSGSTKISFSCVGDVRDWKENFDRDGAAVVKDFSGNWSGPVGDRKLLLRNFPSLGNIELVEHPSNVPLEHQFLFNNAFEC